MQSKLVIWASVLLTAIVLSTFIHEVAHGVSAYLSGHPVSTGFNRVGDAGKRPSDPGFRDEMAGYANPWDMGPAVTLTAAVLFTVLFVRVQSEVALWIFGSLALSNALLRFIPMSMSYLSWLFRGSFVMEDEIGHGILWYEMYGVAALKYVPSVISLVISAVCLYYIFRIFRANAGELYDSGAFLWGSLLAAMVSMPLLNLLDEYFRIDWIP